MARFFGVLQASEQAELQLVSHVIRGEFLAAQPERAGFGAAQIEVAVVQPQPPVAVERARDPELHAPGESNVGLFVLLDRSAHPALLLLHQITEPILAPARKLIPPMGGLDLSPILVFVLINVIQIALRHMAAGIGLHPALVMGL